MKINQCFKDHQVISFEVFPPRKNASNIALTPILNTLDAVKEADPDFVSVTFGAKGNKPHMGTLEVAKLIKDEFDMEPVAHLPAAQLTREQVDAELRSFQDAGIDNILALRGDIPKSGRVSNDFPYACDLIEHIHQVGDFNVVAACYPEKHPESPDVVSDIHHLKEKVDSGASQLISQLFFDNQVFYRFRERAQLAGINVPIEAGIMPVINEHQIERMATMAGVNLPPKFVAMMQHFSGNKEAMRDAGIAYAIDQIVDLLVHGVDGIHIYTMDNPTVVKRIAAATQTIRNA
ncbi:methylenetetrahydrofolate reductase [NAD(P)H] [Lacticaseibacillus paracasei]|uniref:methylenetetrahydrofolate reductase [NAD(P)H] n=1 Tax=Lacticaseibacillus paracasei TaxID=1597 RepID=UPI003C2E45C4